MTPIDVAATPDLDTVPVRRDFGAAYVVTPDARLDAFTIAHGHAEAGRTDAIDRWGLTDATPLHSVSCHDPATLGTRYLFIFTATVPPNSPLNRQRRP